MDGLKSAEKRIIDLLKRKEKVSTSEVQGEYVSVIGAAKKLESFGHIKCTPVKYREAFLTEEGKYVLEKGSPEYILYTLVEKGIPLKDLEEKVKKELEEKKYTEREILNTIKNGKSNGLKAGIVKIEREIVMQAKKKVEDRVRNRLKQVKELEKKEIDLLKKRKLVLEKEVTHYDMEKDVSFGKEIETISDITVDMLEQTDINDRLKKYNFSIVSNSAKYSGAQHPLSLEREKVKRIFLQMGFQEMDAGKYVESSFWNFDALFQPQKHPSRNECDTFFLEDPKNAQDPCMDYLENVKTVHSIGGYGSVGYQAPWSIEESRKNVLRTHTTAVTTRLLYQLSNSAEPKYSGKYFSIDRVFRNESLDATHLAEFHQVEGIVIGKNLTISDLMGFLEVFFGSLGIRKIRFKPTYNPYTEPSVEVVAYHEKMKKWMEIGNSGMFRPEMLLPMGLPEDIRVIGWGLGLERPVMISRGINNIRNLVGHKVDISFIRQGLGKKNAN